jgi:hypothetical protein
MAFFEMSLRAVGRHPLETSALLSRAVDMYAEAQHTSSEEEGITASASSHKPPSKISLLEMHSFRYHGSATSHIRSTTKFSVLRSYTEPPRRNCSRKLASTFLTLVYLTQAITTAVLVIRRTRINRASWLLDGLPIIDNEPSTKQSFAQYGEIYNGVVLFADAQAFRMSLLGILVATTYLALQITDMRWKYIVQNEIWTVTDFEGDFLFRTFSGITLVFNLELAIDLAVILLRDGGLPESSHMMSIFTRSFTRSFAGGIVGGVICKVIDMLCMSVSWTSRSRFKVLRLFESLVSSWTVLFLVDVVYALSTPFRIYLSGFDCNRQFPALNSFVTDRPNGSSITGSSKRQARLRYGIYLMFYFGPGIALYIYHLVNFARIMHSQSEVTIPAVTSRSGCIYTTQLYPWMWKDPKAEILWAF